MDNSALASIKDFLAGCESYKDPALVSSHTTTSALTHAQRHLVNTIFDNVVNFINTKNLSYTNREVSNNFNEENATGCESFNSNLSLKDIGVDAIVELCENCRVPKSLIPTAATTLAMLMARLSAGRQSFYSQQFSNASSNTNYSDTKLTDLHNILPQILHNEFLPTSRPGLEAFGATMDTMLPDIRTAMTITLLKFHRGLLNRVMHRRTSAETVVTYKIPYAEVYDLFAAISKSGEERESQTYRKLFRDLNADPSMVSNTLKRIEVLKTNDKGSQLIADGIIAKDVKVNLMDLSLVAAQFGYSHNDFSDIIADGAILESVYVKATKGATTEYFTLSTRSYTDARLVMQNNTSDSGDRQAVLRRPFKLTKDTLTASGGANTLFSALTDTSCVKVDVVCAPLLNVKWGTCTAAGSAIASAYYTAASEPADLTTAMTGLTIELIGYTLDVKYSEENVRKTNIAVRHHYRTMVWEIPVGRNFVVDYALNQAMPEFIMSNVTEAIALGQDDRMLRIVTTTLNDVYDRLNKENTDANFNEIIEKLGFDFVASQKVRPCVYLANIDCSKVDNLRSADYLGDLRQYVEMFFIHLFALLHQNSFYKQQLNAGEKPVYKCITSNVILECLFNIPHIHNHMQSATDLPFDGDIVEYRRVLPNGVIIDFVSTTFDAMRNKIIIMPYREGDPESELNFAHNWDYGTYLAHYNPQLENGVWKRVFANARELPLVTNPIGLYVEVTNIDSVINMFQTIGIAGGVEGYDTPAIP